MLDFYSQDDVALITSFWYLTYNHNSQKLEEFQNDKNIKKIKILILSNFFWQLPTQFSYRYKRILVCLENLSITTPSKCSQSDFPLWKYTSGKCFQAIKSELLVVGWLLKITVLSIQLTAAVTLKSLKAVERLSSLAMAINPSTLPHLTPFHYRRICITKWKFSSQTQHTLHPQFPAYISYLRVKVTGFQTKQ